ncbi:hypothetical protein PUN28_003392 [Cardiocondyla obscurior]|uniref:Uncharacterized protein n=1 Tax=Cardiocondyla obscurior TaxID=286306 RepID=A0AAW2GK95_9HYME
MIFARLKMHRFALRSKTACCYSASGRHMVKIRLPFHAECILQIIAALSKLQVSETRQFNYVCCIIDVRGAKGGEKKISISYRFLADKKCYLRAFPGSGAQ